ncbi:MAG: DUF4281 domain-containing protein [Myxococcales bacterium]|nr:DUF4281 domain-containing protein [Myxococcales bacterium]
MGLILYLSTFIAVPPWLMMIFFPKWGPTRAIATSPIWAMVLCALYSLMFLPLLPTLFPILALHDLKSLSGAMGTHAAATMLWIHIQAFSLLIGARVYQESEHTAINSWIRSLILFVTMVAGPVGFLAFRIVEKMVGQPQEQVETQATPAEN